MPLVHVRSQELQIPSYGTLLWGRRAPITPCPRTFPGAADTILWGRKAPIAPCPRTFPGAADTLPWHPPLGEEGTDYPLLTYVPRSGRYHPMVPSFGICGREAPFGPFGSASSSSSSSLLSPFAPGGLKPAYVTIFLTAREDFVESVRVYDKDAISPSWNALAPAWYVIGCYFL
jgi:hypothetical protein